MGWRYYTGGVDVSANDPGSPSGFLTCLNGAPLEGVTCKLGGIDGLDLSNKQEMFIVSNPIESGDDGKAIMAAIDGIQTVKMSDVRAWEGVEIFVE
jgi:hypothetical protein